MSLPKWTDERTAQLTEFVGGESPYLKALLRKQLLTLKPLPDLSLASCERWALT